MEESNDNTGEYPSLELEEDQNPWIRLPAELVEKILASLPLPHIFQARRVCRFWRSFLTSPKFYDLWSVASEQQTLFPIYHSDHLLAVYSPYRSQWMEIPLFSCCAVDLRESIPVAAANGLLCFAKSKGREHLLTLCNPLTNSCRELPEVPCIDHIQAVGMTADRFKNSFKILVCGLSFTQGSECTRFYDSSTNQWSNIQNPSRMSNLRRFVFWNGLFCTLIWTEYILAFDLSQNRWRSMGTPLPCPVGCVIGPKLLVIRGHLVLTGRIVQEHFTSAIGIWEFQEEISEWVEVSLMPYEYLEKFCSSVGAPVQRLITRSSFKFQSHAGGDYVCFSRDFGGQLILYHWGKRSWCSISYETRGHLNTWAYDLSGLSFEPSFLAKI